MVALVAGTLLVTALGGPASVGGQRQHRHSVASGPTGQVSKSPTPGASPLAAASPALFSPRPSVVLADSSSFSRHHGPRPNQPTAQGSGSPSPTSSGSPSPSPTTNPPPPPSPTPTPTGGRGVGLFTPGESVSNEESVASSWGVSLVASDVYAAGPAYTSLSGLPAGSSSIRETIAVGAVTPAEATAIGQMLVANGQPDAYIRIMWEFNESGTCWFPWGLDCSGGSDGMTPSIFISTFQAAATAFKAVSNQFVIVWNMNGASSVPAADYPGDSYVDQIGIDQYDYSGYAANMQAAISFAAAHGKPIQVDEWGVMGHDDPNYINSMASLMLNPANDVALQVYFDNATNVLTNYPNALAAYRSDFG